METNSGGHGKDLALVLASMRIEMRCVANTHANEDARGRKNAARKDAIMDPMEQVLPFSYTLSPTPFLSLLNLLVSKKDYKT